MSCPILGELGLEEEDGVWLERDRRLGGGELRIAAPRLSRLSSATDLDASDDGTPVGGALFNHEEACVVSFADGHVSRKARSNHWAALRTSVCRGTLLESRAN